MASILDRAIAALSPDTALRRARARMQLRRFDQPGGRGGYEGAAKGRRTDRWRADSTDAVAAAAEALPLLRARSRDLVRNNAWAAKGVAEVESWTIGTGITGQPRGSTPAARRLLELWRTWSESTSCDADGDLDFAGLQALAMRCQVESGSCLIRRRIRRDSDGLPVPLQLQLIEPDHLDPYRRQAEGSANEVIQGVEYDAIGRRVAYWLYDEHPGTDRPTRTRTYTSRRIPASEVLHLFRSDRVGQVLGVPWLAPAMNRLRMLDEFDDSQLLRMVVASSWAAYITRTADPDTEDDDPLEPLEDVRPGAIEYLNPGETIETPDLPNVSGMDAFTAHELRAIAAALPVPYEALTGDLSRVNYSSGRMGFNAFERHVAKWQRQICRQVLDPVRVWFVEAALAAGAPASSASIEWAWTPPARMILDPKTEGEADYEAVRNGAKTLSDVLRARGRDPREHLTEYAADLALLDELGIVLDLDGRRVAKAGAGAVAGKTDDAETTDSPEDDGAEAEDDESEAEDDAE